METVSVVEARKKLSELMAKVAYGGERVIIERKGKPLVVIVSLNDFHLLESLFPKPSRAEMEKALALADASRARILAERGGVPLPDSAELINELREKRDREIGEAVFGR